MKDFEYFDKHIATVPDFPIKGIQFKDITTTLEDPEAFQEAVNAMSERIEKYDFDKIVCADARGFIFGSPIAYKMKKGLVIARKPNKLPRPGITYSYTLEYGQNTLVISEGAIKPGEKVVIVDDLLATGGSANAMVQMVQQMGGKTVAAVFYIGLPVLHGDAFIQKADPAIEVHTIVDFPDLV